MDKLLIRKDVFNELIEKGYGKKDVSKLQKVQITDKNGHTRNVYKKTGIEQKEGRQPKAQEELTPEKKAKYEEMLEKVKSGSDENALFVQGKMLNKKEAIAHLEGKLGKKPVNSAAQEPGIPIQGTNWLSLPSGTRVTNEGAKEKMAKNNERIETLKKLMEGNTKADNIRLNSELRSLQNENEYIASRLPADKEEKKPSQDDKKENYLDAKEESKNKIKNEYYKRTENQIKERIKEATDIIGKGTSPQEMSRAFAIYENETKRLKELKAELEKPEEDRKDIILPYPDPQNPWEDMANFEAETMNDNDYKVVIKRKNGSISLYGAKDGVHLHDFNTEKERLDYMKKNGLNIDDSAKPELKGGEETINRFKDLYKI